MNCVCGSKARFRCVLDKCVLTTVGEMVVPRRYYACECGCKQVPLDAWAGLSSRMVSAHSRRVISLAGSTWAFDEASQKLLELCGMRISDDTIERVCQEEGQRGGVWMKSAESPGRMMAQAPGEMEFSSDGVKINTTEGWAEMRLNVLCKRESGRGVEPSQWNDRVLPEPSARLAWCAIAPCRLVGASWTRMFKHAGGNKQTKLSVIADGAKWIWDQARRRLPGANTEWVVDIYHVSQHLHDCGKTLLGEGEKARQWAEQRRMELIEQGGPRFIESLGKVRKAARSRAGKKALEQLEHYLRDNQDSLWYRKRLAEGRPIGSGLIEGGCKTIVGQRLKRNSARWRPRRAENIAALRCLEYSGCWDSYWNSRN
jgi:hypothetical protein